MLRQAKARREPEDKDGFRLRSHEISRLEGFTDAVFALAVTLLIVSVETPKSPEDLMNSLYQVPVFAVCFAMIYRLWNNHYTFSRRFGLEDGRTRALTGVLLFTILIFVYPLKYMFSLFILGYLGLNRGLLAGSGKMDESGLQVVMVTYGVAFSCTLSIFALLYAHAYSQRSRLKLDPLEELLTRSAIIEFFGFASVGVVSIILAIVTIGFMKVSAGFIYCALGIVGTLHGLWESRAIRRLDFHRAESLAGVEEPAKNTEE